MEQETRTVTVKCACGNRYTKEIPKNHISGNLWLISSCQQCAPAPPTWPEAGIMEVIDLGPIPERVQTYAYYVRQNGDVVAIARTGLAKPQESIEVIKPDTAGPANDFYEYLEGVAELSALAPHQIRFLQAINEGAWIQCPRIGGRTAMLNKLRELWKLYKELEGKLLPRTRKKV